jgi:hypothetical protein
MSLRTVFVTLLLVACCSVLNLRLSVVDGESMAPSIRAGDSVVTIGVPTDRLSIGSVLLVRDGDRRLLHRLRAIRGDELWLQGDASLDGDGRSVRRSDVLGQLALVIPTSPLLRAIRATARFTASLPLSVSLRSGAGASAQLGMRTLSGADTQGRLLPGGYALWPMTFTACDATGTQCAARYALRIDPSRFGDLLPPAGSIGDPSQALARSLRVTTRCQSLAGGAWGEASDRFTAEWNAAVPLSGVLTEQTAAAARVGLRCETKLTLLGVPAATGGTLVLPLIWGPA